MFLTGEILGFGSVGRRENGGNVFFFLWVLVMVLNDEILVFFWLFGRWEKGI